MRVTTLIVVEICYFIYLVIILAAVAFVGAVASGAAGDMSAYYNNIGPNASAAMKQAKAEYEKVVDAALALKIFGIFAAIAYIPRFVYFVKLCGFGCCGGSRRDTSQDRHGVAVAMVALAVSAAMTAVGSVIIVLAFGGKIGDILHLVII